MCQDAPRPLFGLGVRLGGLIIMIPAIVVGGYLAVAVADRPPVVNFEQTCREEMTGDMRTNDKFEVCIADEKRARDQVAAEWSAFDPAARARCARTSTSGHAASYLELLVCLELDQADREVHGQGSTMGITSTEPGRPVGERDPATDSSQSRPGPIAAPSRPAPIPRSLQQPGARSAVAPPVAPPPAAPPPAAPPPTAPSPPMSEPQPTSQAEVLQQSLCRSPLGYVLPSCR
jgi:hypothetical protein